MPLFISSLSLTIPHADSSFISCYFYGYGQVLLIFNTEIIFFSLYVDDDDTKHSILTSGRRKLDCGTHIAVFFLIISTEQKYSKKDKKIASSEPAIKPYF